MIINQLKLISLCKIWVRTLYAIEDTSTAELYFEKQKLLTTAFWRHSAVTILGIEMNWSTGSIFSFKNRFFSDITVCINLLFSTEPHVKSLPFISIAADEWVLAYIFWNLNSKRDLFVVGSNLVVVSPNPSWPHLLKPQP